VGVHQRSLFATGEPELRPDKETTHVELTGGAWLEVVRGWLGGADELLDHLVSTVAWRRGRRRMYDRMIDDPRLSCWFTAADALPHPVFGVACDALEARFRVTLPTLGLLFYRDGNDSVAFHADRELRELEDTIVAVLTLGACRPFLVRPKHGGRSLDLAPASGDLLVMGGSCQLHYEHGVPKIARAGPRVSATWRAVRGA
jgi:alkylated DNA repair dioxygenase AlkB